MSEDLVPFAELARQRSPALSNPALEELIGSRFMVPPGDPADRAESRRIEDKVTILSGPKHHVVRVLILDHDVMGKQPRILRHGPAKSLLEILEKRGGDEQGAGGHEEKLGSGRLASRDGGHVGLGVLK